MVVRFQADDAPARTSDSGSGTPLQPALPHSRVALGMHDTDDLNRVSLHKIQHLVRNLRTRHMVEVKPAGETREFVKTLSDFKDRLKGTMPDVPDIHGGEK